MSQPTVSKEYHFYLESDFQFWRLVPDVARQVLVAELRNGDLRETAFMALDLQSGEMLWDDLQFEENWWMNLSEVVNGKAYFLEYGDERMPTPTGLYAVDVATKSVLWHREGIQLQKATPEWLLVVKTEENGPEAMVWQATTGQPAKDSPHPANLLAWPLPRPLQPQSYSAGTEHFQTVSQFLLQRTGVATVEKIDYLEFDQNIILAAYEKTEIKLCHHLWLFTKKGKLVHHEILDRETAGIALESFMCLGGLLLFVIEKHTLAALKLDAEY